MPNHNAFLSLRYHNDNIEQCIDGATLPYFVAIGGSGSEGLYDIIDLLGALSKPSTAVVLVTVHRVSYLRETLSRRCDMPVAVARHLDPFVRGTCYVGRPDRHLALVAPDLAHCAPAADTTPRNKAADVLFESLAAHAGKRAIGVALSGSLSDGSRGLAAIHAAQGTTMVLDPGDKPGGMQQNAIDYDGPISFVGTTRQIADRIDHLIA